MNPSDNSSLHAAIANAVGRVVTGRKRPRGMTITIHRRTTSEENMQSVMEIVDRGTMVNTAQLAQILQINRATIYRLAASGVFGAAYFRTGRSMRFDAVACIEALQASKKTAPTLEGGSPCPT